MIKFIKPKFEIDMLGQTGIEKLKHIEKVGRVAYKSEDRITEDSYIKFITMLKNNEHLSVLEHADISVKFTVCRATTHELVRHRICSFIQESQRYVNYNGSVNFIIPTFSKIEDSDDESTLNCSIELQDKIWVEAMIGAYKSYQDLLDQGLKPELARTVLPNSTATTIYIKTNIREWMLIKKLRTHHTASPEMRAVMIPLFEELKKQIPIVFD